MLVSPNAKFHIGLIPQRWYQDSFVLEVYLFSGPVVPATPFEEFGAVEDDSKTTMGEEFGIMKKTLNLAIAAGRVEELYEIHKNFTGQMENKVVSRSGDDHAEFALTINNPVSVRTKGRPKGSNNVNSNIKGKSNQDTRENRVGRPRKVLQEVALNVSESRS
ncbi:12268_t:CDS:2 [Gigaspora rosea]|nr:12268_t:CDS:2 [Gigaspora rosea]